MKKILVSAVAVMMLTGISFCFAGVKEANELYNQKKYVEAETEYRNVLPELKGIEKGNIQVKIGDCLRFQGKYDEAIKEYKNVLSVPDAHFITASVAQLNIGVCLELQKKYDEAIAEYNKVPAHPQYLSLAKLFIGRCLEAQGKDGQQAYKEGFRIKGGYCLYFLPLIKDISDCADAFVLHLSTLPKTDAQSEMSDIRRALLKKASENSSVCREIVKMMSDDLVVFAELKPFLELYKISVKQQAEIYLTVWKANLSKVVEDEESRKVVDGCVTALVQLLGLSENPSIAEVEAKLAEIK